MLLLYFLLFQVSYKLSECKTIDTGVKNVNLFPLSIIHLNDFHARYEEVNEISTNCKREEGERCIGGYARIVSKVKSLKEEKHDKNPIYLNAGDNFQGTFWYKLLRWNVTSYFLNLLPADAIVLGNHEFDDGIQGILPFLDAIKSPILIANMDDTEEPSIQGMYKKSIVINRSGRKIGIIGVIHQTTSELSMPGKLKFLDEVDAVKREATILKENGVDIIIVLSHCGVTVDKKIANDAGSLVDIIVGGHSHTFLYNGTQHPGPDFPEDTYPIVVNHGDSPVLIVQASCFSKYLGDITVYFDESNAIIKWDGNPIYLDESIPNDPEIVREMIPWKKEIDQYSERVIGSSKVLLSKSECKVIECNIGNFMADSFVDYYASQAVDTNVWTNSSIAIINDGGIRSSLNPGTLTYNDIVTAVPYENTIDTFDLKGKYLLEAFEYAAQSYGTANMIQVSGVKVIYNITKEIGDKVISAKVLCRTCDVPEYENVDPLVTYRLIVPEWIGNGGNGFTMFSKHRENLRKGPLDVEIISKYVEKITPIVQATDGRVQIIH